MILHYCERCGKRIAADALNRGHARRLATGIYCRVCLVALEKVKKKEAVGEAPPAELPPPVAPAPPVKEDPPARALERPGSWVVTAAIAAAVLSVALVVAAAIVLSRPSAEREGPPSVTTARSSAPRDGPSRKQKRSPPAGAGTGRAQDEVDATRLNVRALIREGRFELAAAHVERLTKAGRRKSPASRALRQELGAAWTRRLEARMTEAENIEALGEPALARSVYEEISREVPGMPKGAGAIAARARAALKRIAAAPPPAVEIRPPAPKPPRADSQTEAARPEQPEPPQPAIQAPEKRPREVAEPSSSPAPAAEAPPRAPELVEVPGTEMLGPWPVNVEVARELEANILISQLNVALKANRFADVREKIIELQARYGTTQNMAHNRQGLDKLLAQLAQRGFRVPDAPAEPQDTKGEPPAVVGGSGRLQATYVQGFDGRRARHWRGQFAEGHGGGKAAAPEYYAADSPVGFLLAARAPPGEAIARLGADPALSFRLYVDRPVDVTIMIHNATRKAALRGHLPAASLRPGEWSRYFWKLDTLTRDTQAGPVQVASGDRVDTLYLYGGKAGQAVDLRVDDVLFTAGGDPDRPVRRELDRLDRLIADVTRNPEREGIYSDLSVVSRLRAIVASAQAGGPRRRGQVLLVSGPASLARALAKVLRDAPKRKGLLAPAVQVKGAPALPATRNASHLRAGLRSARPEVVFLMLGAPEARRGIAPEKAEAGYRALVQQVVEAGAAPVLVTPIVRRIGSSKASDAGSRQAQFIADLGERMHLPVVDAYRLVNPDGGDGGPKRTGARLWRSAWVLSPGGIDRVTQKLREAYVLIERHILGRVGAGGERPAVVPDRAEPDEDANEE